MTSLSCFRQEVESKPPSSVILLHFICVASHIRDTKKGTWRRVSIFVKGKDEPTRIEEYAEKDKRSRARLVSSRKTLNQL